MTADQPFETELTESLRRVVGADSTGLNVWHGWPHAAAAVTVAGVPPLPASEHEAWTRQYAEHPYFTHLLATGDPRAYRVTDFMASHRFEQTPIYRELLAHYGLRYQLLMTLRLTRHDLVFVSLLRSLHDFSDREVAAVGQLRGPLSAALEYQAEVRAIQATMARSDQPQLSPRERQVLELVAVGCTNDQAARRLGISSRTVRKHLEGVFAKAQVPCRTAAVAWWLRQSGAGAGSGSPLGG
jgi:DNA-binding CsgD family transcriptional regulator